MPDNRDKIVRRRIIDGRISKKVISHLIRILSFIKTMFRLINTSPILSILISLTIAILAYWLTLPPDFSISINNMAFIGPEQYTFGFSKELNISNSNKLYYCPYISHFYSYPYPVVLKLNSNDGRQLPIGIKATFKPAGNVSIPFNSTMKVSCSNLSEGIYMLKISAFGGDGRERSCPLLLEVINYKNITS